MVLLLPPDVIELTVILLWYSRIQANHKSTLCKTRENIFKPTWLIEYKQHPLSKNRVSFFDILILLGFGQLSSAHSKVSWPFCDLLHLCLRYHHRSAFCFILLSICWPVQLCIYDKSQNFYSTPCPCDDNIILSQFKYIEKYIKKSGTWLSLSVPQRKI